MKFHRFTFFVVGVCLSVSVAAQMPGIPDPIFPAGGTEWPLWTPAERSSVQSEQLPSISAEAFHLYMALEARWQIKSASHFIPAATTSSISSAGSPTDARDMVGRLTFIEKARGHYCTAQIVGRNGDVILTAAHCIRSSEKPNEKYRKFEFIRAYGDPGAEIFSVGCAASWSTFPSAKSPNYSVDYAFAKLKTGKKMSLEVSPAIPRNSTAMGYPQNMNSGQVLSAVHGKVQSMGGGILQMEPNGMGDGASGGAWVDDSAPRVFSVNSFRVNGESNHVYGPELDSSISDLFEFVENDCK
jgi:hypothetical protein